jgi:Ca-activated chloride channel homolog
MGVALTMLNITFQEPSWLWLLLALLPIAAWDTRRRWRPQARADVQQPGASVGSPLSAARKLGSAALRVVMLGALVVALAKPVSLVDEAMAPVVFVVDRSASVSEAALQDAYTQAQRWRGGLSHEEQASLVVFDGQPTLLAHAGQAWPEGPLPRDPVHAEATDLAAALEMALGLIPPDVQGQVVLLTDAQPTRGDVTDILAEARARGVLVHTMPLERVPHTPDVTQVVLDSSLLRPGEAMKGHLAFQGKTPGPGKIAFTLSGQPLGEPVDVSPEPTADGGFQLPFSRDLPADLKAGPVELKATFTPSGPGSDASSPQTVAQDVVVDDPPRVIVITQPVKNGQGSLTDDAAEVEPILAVLRSEGMVVERISTPDLAAQSADEQKKLFERADLFVLANVAVKLPGAIAPTVSEDFLEALRRFVSGGGGLITLGGDRSYELGGYARTPLARILPVKVDPLDVEVDPAVTMMIVLDRSGSMGASAGGGKTKMDLANAGSVASMKLLRPFDYVGVTAVDERSNWIVPIQPVVEREAIERAILTISAGGGGIYVYTSLVDARQALLNVETPLRHILLFSDTRDSEEQVKDTPFGWGPGHNCYDLAREMRENEGITTSVIGIGAEYDSDTAFLKRVAEEGGGRFYITEDANKLLALFVEETQRLIKSRLHEENFSVSLTRAHPALDGIDFTEAPQLRGYLELEARDTAEVLLRGAKDHPVLVTWQYGLGYVFSASTDLGPRWGSSWIDWVGFDRLWTQLTRHALMRKEGRATSVGVDFSGDSTRIQVVRRNPEGLTSDHSGLRARIIELNPDGTPGAVSQLSLQSREPGLWQTDASLKHRQTYRVEVSDASGEVLSQHTFISPPSAERRPAATDTARLIAIASSTGALSLSEAVSSLPDLETSRPRPEPTWFYWALLAALLLPFDAFLRRPAREI